MILRLPARKSRAGRALLSALLVAGTVGATPLVAQISLTLQSDTATNPRTSEADVAAGQRVFRTSCAICHGAEGEGGAGPPLTRGDFRHGSSDRALFRNILTGIRGTGMAGVYRPDTQIWQVVSYVRSLAKGGGDVEIPGDPERGRRLFETRGGCPDCHRIDGHGGRLGPDLSALGWRRSPAHIRESLLEPDRAIEDDERTVRVKTGAGENATGVLLSEDTFSIRLLDENENLRAFSKSDLVEIDKPGTSLMPPMGGFFRGRELDDLVAYLYSLRKE